MLIIIKLQLSVHNDIESMRTYQKLSLSISIYYVSLGSEVW